MLSAKRGRVGNPPCALTTDRIEKIADLRIAISDSCFPSTASSCAKLSVLFERFLPEDHTNLSVSCVLSVACNGNKKSSLWSTVLMQEHRVLLCSCKAEIDGGLMVVNTKRTEQEEGPHCEGTTREVLFVSDICRRCPFRLSSSNVEAPTCSFGFN